MRTVSSRETGSRYNFKEKEMTHHMTKEEKLKIIEDAEDRCYAALCGMDVTDARFEAMLGRLRDLYHAKNLLDWADDSPAPEPDCGKGEVKPVKEPVKLDPIEEPKPEPETPTITKQQMVTKLTAFQSGGVAIDLVMQSMGYAKLSQVPAERYGELLENCQKIADGEG